MKSTGILYTDHNNNKAGRNVSLDVLRCLLMFGVVLQHTFAVCKYGCVVAYASYIVWDCLTHPSVDGFTAISGWFGVRCTLKKLVRLASLIFFCGTIHWFIYQIGRSTCGSYFSSRFGMNIPDLPYGYENYRYWYLGAYIKLMLLTIVLNPLFAYIAQLRKYWVWIIAMVTVGGSYLSTFWFPWQSHSPRTVIFVYVLVRIAVILGLEKKIRESRKFRTGTFFLFAVMFSIIVLDALFRKYNVTVWCRMGLNLGSYANPLTILTGVLLVACFSVVKFTQKSRIVRFCSLIAPSMISVYMLHWNFMATFFKPIPQLLLANIPHVSVALAFFVCAIAIFFLCVGIDMLRRKCLDIMLPKFPIQINRFFI